MDPTLAELVDRGRIIVQSARQLLIDFDIEADGIAGHGSILSIGAVSPFGDKFYAELKPSSHLFIASQHDFCEAHGLKRERLLREGRDPAEVMRAFVEWATRLKQRSKKEGVVLTAFNTGFDFSLLRLALYQNGCENPFGYGGFCSQSYALAASPNHNWDNASVSWMAATFGTVAELTHHALQDAKDQQIMHFVLAAYLAELRG